MDTFGHLDYLSLTFPAGTDERLFRLYFGEFKDIGTGPHGYQRMAKSEIGAVLLAEGSEAQGKNLTLKGQQLQTIRDADIPDHAILDFAAVNHAKASRVDLALDLFDSPITVSDLWAQYHDGLIVTRAREDKRFTAKLGTDDGFYVGSLKSDKLLRVYNKGAQLAVDERAWLRLELMCRKVVARAAVNSMVGQSKLRPFINAAIKDFCDWPACAAFQEATADDDADLPVLGRKPSNFHRWLVEQVVPALVKRDMEYPEERNLHTLQLLYVQEHRRRTDGLRN